LACPLLEVPVLVDLKTGEKKHVFEPDDEEEEPQKVMYLLEWNNNFSDPLKPVQLIALWLPLIKRETRYSLETQKE
jgi:hypothetical protein